MSNRRNIQFTYTPHNKATILDCTFTVTPSVGAGTSALAQSGRVSTVFMHTSTTPVAGNPNPEAGIIIVNLQDNYSNYLTCYPTITAPLTGTSISISGTSVMTVGNPYVITALGTSTQANWVAMGLPATITAAVGVSFIASATGGGTGTGTVQAPAAAGSGIDHIELLGNPDVMNSNGAMLLGSSAGMQLMFACYKNGTLTAPTAGTTIALNLYMNDTVTGV